MPRSRLFARRAETVATEPTRVCRPRWAPKQSVLLQHPPDRLLQNLVRKKLVAQVVGQAARSSGVELAIRVPQGGVAPGASNPSRAPPGCACSTSRGAGARNPA